MVQAFVLSGINTAVPKPWIFTVQGVPDVPDVPGVQDVELFCTKILCHILLEFVLSKLCKEKLINFIDFDYFFYSKRETRK